MESMLISLNISANHVHDQPMPERMIALVSADEHDILAVFGSEMDMASRYVAQMCDNQRILKGTHLSVVQGKDISGDRHVAVLDAQGRAWAITGPEWDDPSIQVALTLTQHPAFQEAVATAQERNLVLTRPVPAG